MKKEKSALSKKLENITVKTLQNEVLHFSVMVVLVLFALLLLYLLSTLLSSDKQGADYLIAQGLHILIVVFLSWLVMRAFQVLFVTRFNKTHNRPLPRYVITLFNWGIAITAIPQLNNVIT